ncbi:tripartite tricarboxylate transporter TctB family protein [Roseovarius sp.]|uniref:tripartite tricarboxylate transporter TctB family protein n=1 Tax=Roseovarius sp. TaxID=1486281 RepID=UPI003511B8C8
MSDLSPDLPPQPGGRALQITVALAILALAALLFSQTFAEISAFAQSSQGRGPFFYPRFLMAGIAVLALTMALRPALSDEVRPKGAGLRRLIGLIAAVVAYALGLAYLGFLISSLLFACLTPLFLGYRRAVVIPLVAVAFSVSVWWLFESVFLIILPRSAWFSGF